jgi:hypothetical protein
MQSESSPSVEIKRSAHVEESIHFITSMMSRYSLEKVNECSQVIRDVILGDRKGKIEVLQAELNRIEESLKSL